MECEYCGGISHCLIFFAGLILLEKYEADLAKVVAAQQDLMDAEILLDLPVTAYPEVISIQESMKGLRQVYDLYTAQKVRYGAYD